MAFAVGTLNTYITGIESAFYAGVIAIVLFLYAYLMVPVVRRNFRDAEPGRWSSLADLLMIVAIGVIVLVPTSASGFIFIYPLTWYSVVFGGAWALICFLVAHLIPKKARDATGKRQDTAVPEGVNPATYNFDMRAELKRKLVHLIALIYLVAFIFGMFVFDLVWTYAYVPLKPFSSQEVVTNTLELARGDPLDTGAAILVFALITSMYVQLNAEITRLRFPHKTFILEATMLKTKRETERNSFAANIHMVPAMTLATILLVWDPTYRYAGTMAAVAMLVASLMGDMAAALVGRQFGRHKWPFLKNKSLEGTFAGMLVTFSSCLPFVGPWGALAATGVFWVTDIALGKVNLSDNITTPLLLGVVFWLMLPVLSPLVSTIPHVPPIG